MNKIIFTNDRLFMSLVGPAGSGKTRLVFAMFVPCLDFEMIKKLENCLVVFDDSCEKIYQEKEVDKIVVAGRYKKIHCIFVKHNLFHQSKWSRTIDFNITRCPI